MSITLEQLDHFIDCMKANAAEASGQSYYFYISPSMHHSVQMLAQGKRFYRGKPHKRKSLARQPRAIRKIRLQHIKHVRTIHDVKFFYETMGG